MAKRHHELMARLDPVGLSQHQITEKDVRNVEKYLSIIQKKLKGIASTWEDIARYGGVYGTSILIHEVVELRLLEDYGLKPLRQKEQQLRQLLEQHIDVHVIATVEEHRYLQQVIQRQYHQTFEVATLVKANRGDDRDLQEFLESDIGIFLLEEEQVEAARQIITRLKGETNG